MTSKPWKCGGTVQIIQEENMGERMENTGILMGDSLDIWCIECWKKEGTLEEENTNKSSKKYNKSSGQNIDIISTFGVLPMDISTRKTWGKLTSKFKYLKEK